MVPRASGLPICTVGVMPAAAITDAQASLVPNAKPSSAAGPAAVHLQQSTRSGMLLLCTLPSRSGCRLWRQGGMWVGRVRARPSMTRAQQPAISLRSCIWPQA